MHWLPALGEILERAAYLLALALVPPLFSPEPPPPANLAVAAVASAAVLAALALGAARFVGRPAAGDTIAASTLVLAALAASIAAATFFRSERAPLGRGVLYVALPLWAGLAVAAGAVAERRLPSGFRHKRLAATTGVALAAALLLASASRWLLSPERMWWEAIHHDGHNAAAVDALTRTAARARDNPAVLRVLDGCPEACACLARRAEIEARTGAPEAALAHARAATERCPADTAARVALVETLTFRGDAAEAEHEARAALGHGENGKLRYALALALDYQGRRAEAADEARRAVELGAGRDAALLVGAFAINAGDLDAATRALGPLAVDSGDAEAQYDLALVADKKGDYNRARNGYLAALRADPRNADARYNLVLLTLRQGVVEEARHHAKRFAEAFPADRRNVDLTRMLAGR